jgi:poly(3-hydroxybutyrate) depolymerase
LWLASPEIRCQIIGANIGANNAERDLRDLGRTPVLASRRDTRFSYCLYVPPGYATAAQPPALVIAVHGSYRWFWAYRDAFAQFAEAQNCLILCPLFPIGVRGDGERHGYKYLLEGDLRYDLVLDGIVDEVAVTYGLVDRRFALFGFSGGAHFTHRYLILHPQRVWAASIAAPGSVTLLDPARDWWVGTRNIGALFGVELDLAALAHVPVQMLIGDRDLDTSEITHMAGGRWSMPGANDAGRNRPERLDALRRSFEGAGVAVRFEVLPGVDHDGMAPVMPAISFLTDAVRAIR